MEQKSEKSEAEKIYYIEAATGASTRIGRTAIMPKQPPVPFTEKQYEGHWQIIEHYVKAGIITVSTPGTAASARAAKEIKQETERQEKVFADGKVPPAPMVRTLGFQEPEAEKIATFSAPAESEALICWAVTAKGNRCSKDAVKDLLVCKTHLAMLKRGKEVYDYDGNRIAEDGESLD